MSLKKEGGASDEQVIQDQEQGVRAVNRSSDSQDEQNSQADDGQRPPNSSRHGDQNETESSVTQTNHIIMDTNSQETEQDADPNNIGDTTNFNEQRVVPQPDSLIYIKDQISDTISKGATSPVNPDEKQISQKTKLFLMSAEDQFMYKFFFYLPVGVSFLIYSILTYFYVFYYLEPSINGDFYSETKIPMMWTSEQERLDGVNNVVILAIVFAFCCISLLINLILTIITEPGSVPEIPEMNIPEDKSERSNTTVVLNPNIQDSQYLRKKQRSLNNTQTLELPRDSVQSDLSHAIEIHNRLAEQNVRAMNNDEISNNNINRDIQKEEEQHLEGGSPFNDAGTQSSEKMSQEFHAGNGYQEGGTGSADNERQNTATLATIQQNILMQDTVQDEQFSIQQQSLQYNIESEDNELQQPLFQRDSVKRKKKQAKKQNEINKRQPRDSVLISIERKDNGEFRKCRRCLQMKPDRTHHCSQCHRCILKMDHHCDWVGNCIGFFNYKYFLNTLMYASICTNMIVLTSRRVVKVAMNVDSVPLATTFFVVVAYVLSCILAFIITLFFFFHLWLTMNQYTTIEYREKKGSNKLFKQKSPYDLGIYKNLQAVLGKNCLLWFVPGFRNLDGNGLYFEVRSDIIPDEDQQKQQNEPKAGRNLPSTAVII